MGFSLFILVYATKNHHLEEERKTLKKNRVLHRNIAIFLRHNCSLLLIGMSVPYILPCSVSYSGWIVEYPEKEKEILLLHLDIALSDCNKVLEFVLFLFLHQRFHQFNHILYTQTFFSLFLSLLQKKKSLSFIQTLRYHSSAYCSII